jgi:hypothetical protein
MTMFSFAEIRQHLRNFQIAFPLRLQNLYFVNLPWFAVKLAQLIKNFLRKKLSDRIHFIDRNEELCRFINPAILPQDYGGNLTISEIIEHTKNLMSTNTRENLFKFDNFIKTKFETSNV